MERTRIAVRNKLRSHHAAGFTLTELMVVVAIIGILAVIAYPSYRNYIKKSNRAAAESFLMDVANREKQYLLDSRQYTNSLVTLNIAALPTEVSNAYSVAIAVTNPANAAPTFTITATPNTSQASDGTLTLNETGTKQRLVSSVDKGW